MPHDGELVAGAGAVRDLLRSLLDRARGLLGVARRQRQEQRAVRPTLASLRKLGPPGR